MPKNATKTKYIAIKILSGRIKFRFYIIEPDFSFLVKNRKNFLLTIYLWLVFVCMCMVDFGISSCLLGLV